MRCFRDEEDDAHARRTGQRGLQPEDVAPARVGDNDAADEGAECGSNQRAGEEEAVHCPTFDGPVDIPDYSTAYIELARIR